MVPDLANENSRSASPSNSITGSRSSNAADVTTPATERPMSRSPSTVLQGMNMDVLERLARQVEYYFSDVNLEKDAYVSTLRSLNDGYVPLSIISKFGKVKILAPQDSIDAVRKAATNCSELLEIVHIDKRTGKRLDDRIEASSLDSQTVEAVGPKTREPIPMSSIQTHPLSPCASRPKAAPAQVQNTVIIREVPEGTQDSHIRDLFTSERCPQIKSLYPDVANCW
jgi:La domain